MCVALFFWRYHIKKQSYPCNWPWRPTGFWYVEVPIFCRQQRHKRAERISTLCFNHPLPSQWFQILRQLEGHVGLEGSSRLKLQLLHCESNPWPSRSYYLLTKAKDITYEVLFRGMVSRNYWNSKKSSVAFSRKLSNYFGAHPYDSYLRWIHSWTWDLNEVCPTVQELGRQHIYTYIDRQHSKHNSFVFTGKETCQVIIVPRPDHNPVYHVYTRKQEQHQNIL